MKTASRILALVMVLAMLITACSKRSEQSSAEPPSQADNTNPSTSDVQSGAETADFDVLVEQYRAEGSLVVDSAYGDPMENTMLLAEWVSAYNQQDYESTVAVFLDAHGMGDALYILECDGGPEYTVTVHSESGEETYRSSKVIERAYDYVFGADIPSEEKQYAVVLHHSTPVGTVENLVIHELRPLYGITPAEAEVRARDTEERIYTSTSAGYAGGYYLKEDATSPMPEGYTLPSFKAVGVVRLQDRLYYLVCGNADKTALEKGEHGGVVYAVSADGALVFTQSMEGGEWIFVDDVNQAVYPGAWPNMEGFDVKVKALGYTDAQLDLLAESDWAGANTALNLSKQANGFDFKQTYGRYELDGYLCAAGGEAMTAIKYVRDSVTGRVTILPDMDNGYSDFGFIDDTTFYAAIAQVGGADYEAGVRFYNAEAPAAPYARWNLTDSNVQSDMEKVLLNAYYDKESGLLAAFWCEIPESWGGWVEGDTQTYQVTVLDRNGKAINSFDTGVKLVQGHLNILHPDFEQPDWYPYPVTGVMYFGLGDDGYSVNLETGEIVEEKEPETQEQSNTASTALFSLNPDGQNAQTMRAGDTLGDWTMTDLLVRGEDGYDLHIEADFEGNVTLRGKISRSYLAEDSYDFTVSEEDAAKIPHYVSNGTVDERDRIFGLGFGENAEALAALSKMNLGNPGEDERDCIITISSYHFIRAPMMAYPTAKVVEIKEP